MFDGWMREGTPECKDQETIPMPGILSSLQKVATQPEVLNGEKVEIMPAMPATGPSNQGLPDDPT